jgi:hypothetical protein
MPGMPVHTGPGALRFSPFHRAFIGSARLDSQPLQLAEHAQQLPALRVTVNKPEMAANQAPSDICGSFLECQAGARTTAATAESCECNTRSSAKIQ